MSYLQKLGLGEANYDLKPFVAVDGFDDACWCGWSDIGQTLHRAIQELAKPKVVVAIECYSGILDSEVVPALKSALKADLWIETEAEAFKSPGAIDDLLEPELGGDDPIFGRMTRLTLADYLDSEKVASAQNRIDSLESGVTVLYGPAALLCHDTPDLVVYADMARWEAQMRQRADKISNLGVDNKTLKASLQYKRSFFIDWRACDKLKRKSFEQWDFLLDTCTENEPKLITGDAFRAGLDQAATQPFRVVPFFDPGVWGGQWMREVCQLPSRDSFDQSSFPPSRCAPRRARARPVWSRVPDSFRLPRHHAGAESKFPSAPSGGLRQ